MIDIHCSFGVSPVDARSPQIARDTTNCSFIYPLIADTGSIEIKELEWGLHDSRVACPDTEQK